MDKYDLSFDWFTEHSEEDPYDEDILLDILQDAYYRENMMECGLCGGLYFPEYYSDGRPRLICYSKKCEDEYNAARSIPDKDPKPVLEKKIREVKTEIEILDKGKTGYVYLMISENGLHKIGRSKNIKSRLDGLNREIPVKVECVHFIACHDYMACEKFMHNRFSAKRVKYEWFDLMMEEIEWIMSLGDYQIDELRKSDA